MWETQQEEFKPTPKISVPVSILGSASSRGSSSTAPRLALEGTVSPAFRELWKAECLDFRRVMNDWSTAESERMQKHVQEEELARDMYRGWEPWEARQWLKLAVWPNVDSETAEECIRALIAWSVDPRGTNRSFKSEWKTLKRELGISDRSCQEMLARASQLG